MALSPSAGLPRLVATDLDGTIVRSDHTVSGRTREVLVELDERGVPVVFVTGRPLRWMEELWDAVGAHGLAIVANGAVVYDVTSRSVRNLTGITRDDGLRLAGTITADVPGATFAIETVDGIRLGDGFAGRRPHPDGTIRGPLEEVWDQDAIKVLVRHPSLPFEELREAVSASVGELATPSWSMEGLVEISAAGITKAATLERVSTELGVDAADVIAFGDMPNDLAMLTWAGTSYAMGNAHPSVREVADHVAPTNDEDGVATVLTALFDL
ncbi:MAG: family phosphatase [Marmoricola sp.]|nr:family phosphatase [Marmoricola sp.]